MLNLHKSNYMHVKAKRKTRQCTHQTAICKNTTNCTKPNKLTRILVYWKNHGNYQWSTL